jgi:shikimate kinase
LGDDAFLAAEGEEVRRLVLNERCIVSLTGSNPLHAGAMKHIHSLGHTVFLDVPHADVLSRLSKMKVDRIVGHGVTMSDTLVYRQQFYEGFFISLLLTSEFNTEA